MTIYYVNGTGEPNIYGFREDSDDDWKCDKSSRKLIVSKYIFDQNKFSKTQFQNMRVIFLGIL